MKLFNRRTLIYAAVVLMVGSAVSLAIVQPLSAATAGPNLPGTGANNTSIGTTAWTSPGNVTATDANRASASLATTATSNYLLATNFGFAIPAGSTIDGVSVTINRLEGNLSTRAAIQDSTLLLSKAGTIAGTNHASASNWPTTEGAASYGGVADLWGITLTSTDVNASNFGVALSVVNIKSGPGGTETALVNSVTMTITYTAPSGSYSLPTSATQYFADGSTLLPTGGVSSGEQQIFKAVVTSPNSSDSLTIQFEARLVGSAFTGTATHTSSSVACSGGTCASGVEASVTTTGLAPGTYHWQVRSVGSSGSSAWASYPLVSTNAESATDFAVIAPSSLMRGGKTFVNEAQQAACSTGSCK